MLEYKGLSKPVEIIRALRRHRYSDLLLIFLVILAFCVLIIASFS
jgi:hypothetical protein